MTREEAIAMLKSKMDGSVDTSYEWTETVRMAIEALQTDIVKCENCKYQDECEEVVLFEVTDNEVMGHRVYWCSYGRSE